MPRCFMRRCLDLSGKGRLNHELSFSISSKLMEGENVFTQSICPSGHVALTPLWSFTAARAARIHHVSERHFRQPRPRLANRGYPGLHPPAPLCRLYSAGPDFAAHSRPAGGMGLLESTARAGNMNQRGGGAATRMELSRIESGKLAKLLEARSFHPRFSTLHPRLRLCLAFPLRASGLRH